MCVFLPRLPWGVTTPRSPRHPPVTSPSRCQKAVRESKQLSRALWPSVLGPPPPPPPSRWPSGRPTGAEPGDPQPGPGRGSQSPKAAPPGTTSELSFQDERVSWRLRWAVHPLRPGHPGPGGTLGAAGRAGNCPVLCRTPGRRGFHTGNSATPPADPQFGSVPTLLGARARPSRQGLRPTGRPHFRRPRPRLHHLHF